MHCLEVDSGFLLFKEIVTWNMVEKLASIMVLLLMFFQGCNDTCIDIKYSISFDTFKIYELTWKH